VIWTGLIVLTVAGLVIGGNFLPGLLHPAAPKLGVTPAVSGALVAQLAESGAQLGIDVTVVRVADDATGNSQLSDGTLDALLVDPATLRFHTEVDASVAAVVNHAVQVESLPRRLSAVGLTAQQAQPLIAPTAVNVELQQPPKPGAKTGSPYEDQSYFIAIISVILLLMSLSLYGGLVLNGVVEEKTNRVVEVLMGTLHPSELLAGKVFGIVAVALIQLLAGLGSGAVAMLVVGHAHIPSVAFGAAAVAVGWFVLGLVFYNFGYAAVGATVSRASDAQSAAMPMTLLLLVPYLASFVLIPQHPNSPAAVALSLFPLTAPIAMPARFAIGAAPLWQLGLAYALMLPAILGMVWLAGRVYRGAVLRGGQRVPLLQAFRSGRHDGTA
jgi:ABC-2 type transport system permease protein